MNIFNGHSDLWEDVDEKRIRGIKHIIDSYHFDDWNKGEICGGIYPIWVNPDSDEDSLIQAQHIMKNMCLELCEGKNDIAIVRKYEDLVEALEGRKHAMILGAEGLSFVGEDVDMLHLLYLAGFRSLSLTWNETNALASGAGASVDEDLGLTRSGAECIDLMNHLGIIVDLAHSSQKTFWDIIDRMEKPCIVSHGNCAALSNHPRNYTDEQIEAIKRLNGVVAVSAYPPFVSEDPNKQNLESLIDHVDHIVEVAGIDTVGLGFDLVDFLDDRGIDPTISMDTKGFENISKGQDLVNELVKRGYSRGEIEKICYKNFFRVVRDVLQ